jgi:DNA-binding NarL/FixJ family response regulator
MKKSTPKYRLGGKLMSLNLQCLDSTNIDSLEVPRSFSQKSSNYNLNCALTYVAQEVSRLIQQANSVRVDGSNPADTITIRAIEPEYRKIITIEPLTERELEVLQLIVDGHSNDRIAWKLYISVGTVKTHVRNILKKLCASDRTQAAIRALRSGLVY